MPIVSAYKELASGTDVSQLKPSEITAYVFKYLEENEVDTTGLTPDSVTATVMAYEEITGGASTAALKPSDIVGLIVKYAEAENVDLSSLNSAQVEGIVTKFSEATGCDKSELMKEFVAYITEYKEANGVKKPTLNMQVGLTGYDMLAYRQWLKNNKVEVEGIVRLSEAYEDPTGALHDPGVKFWKDGQEIPVSAVTEDMLKPEDVAVLDKDGTMHVLITAEVTGAPEAIAEMREQVSEVDQLGLTSFGKLIVQPKTLMDYISQARAQIRTAKEDAQAWYSFIYGGESGRMEILDNYIQRGFDPESIASLSTYVAEIVKAIQNGEAVSQEDMDNLQNILAFVQELDAVGVGGNVTAGIAEGMTEAGWDTTAETVAENLEEAINSAFIIESPSKRMEPTGEYVAAGIGEGMAGYDFTMDVASMVTALQTTISAALPGTLKNASSAAGCVTTDEKLGKWAYWGWLKDVAKTDSLPPTPAEPTEGDEEPMAEFATVIADSGSTVNMRSKARSTAALVERVPLGARVEVLGTCGSWTKVKFGSRTGYMMTKFLIAEDDQEPDEDLTLEERVTRLEKRVAMLEAYDGAVG